MKKVRLFLLCSLAFTGWAANPPAPPGNPVNPLLPPQVMVLVTNVTLVYTNCAVKTPAQTFTNVTIYGGTNVFKGATVIAWNPSLSTNPPPNGYKLYYGPTATTTTNTFPTQASVTTVLFYSVLSTNLTYWMNVTATSTNGDSLPSNTILVQPSQ